MYSQKNPSELATVGDWIRFATSRFSASELHYGHGTRNAADEAHALVMQALGLGFEPAPYVYQAAMTKAEREHVASLVERRVVERIPLPYLFGKAWFCGLEFIVDPRVLIPRSPMAELIEARFEPWAALAPGARVLDMCTGSACIAIACAAWLEDVTVDAVDIDEDALNVARQNVEMHDMAGRVTLHRSDLFDSLPGKRYDLIVANPPYVPHTSMETLPPEYAHEPGGALRADADGLALVHRLLADGAHYLSDDGVMVVEVGESADEFVRLYPDLAAVWCEFERGGDGVFVVGAQALRESGASKKMRDSTNVG